MKPLANLYRPFARIFRSFFPVQEDGVLGVIMHEGKILFVKNQFGSRKWTFPGGGVKEGEEPRATLAREIKEELGIDPEIGRPLGYISRPKGMKNSNYMRRGIFAFEGSLADAELHPDPKEILDARWFSPHELPAPMTETAERVFEKWKEPQNLF